jgi:hypothetical protein
VDWLGGRATKALLRLQIDEADPLGDLRLVTPRGVTLWLMPTSDFRQGRVIRDLIGLVLVEDVIEEQQTVWC